MFSLRSPSVFQTRDELKNSSLESITKELNSRPDCLLNLLSSYKNKLSLSEVEDIINRHPAVLHAAVGGIHDPERNEVVPGAFVALKRTVTDHPDALAELANYKIVSQKIVKGSLCLVVTLPQKGTASHKQCSISKILEESNKPKSSTEMAPPAA